MKVMRKHGTKAGLLGLLAFLAIAAAPVASAHRWGISIAGPGFGIGYSDCRHCRGGLVSGYVGGYYPGYYRPAYYGYPYPAYGAVYYERPVVYRSHHRVRYHHRDRYDHHRAHYYDRDGY